MSKERILKVPLPDILDEMDENTNLVRELAKQAMEAALRSEKAATISEEAAKEAVEAAAVEAAKAFAVALKSAEEAKNLARAIGEETRKQLKDSEKYLYDLYHKAMVALAECFPLFKLIADVYVEEGKAKEMWGKQVKDKIAEVEKIVLDI